MAFTSREVTELLKKALELPVTDRAELAGSKIESQITLKTNRLKPPGMPKSTEACKISTQAPLSRFRTTNFGGDSLTQSNERLLTFLSRQVSSLHTPTSVLPRAAFELS
jgi:hypothetical protein